MEHKLCARVANLLMGSGLFASVVFGAIIHKSKN